MHYYPRHVGDYVSATAHLSMLEDGAYNRLLDWYYQEEKPLPSEKRLIYRRIRAASKQEREAVDAVLAEFFSLSDDGFRHSRCDAEIAKNNERAAKARRSAEMRWQCVGNANASDEHMRTHSEGNAIDEHTEGNAIQKPKAKSQYSEQSSSSGGVAQTRPRPTKRAPPGFEVTDAMRAWAASDSPGVDVDRETAKFRDYQFRDGHSDWVATWRNWIRKAAEQHRPVTPIRPVWQGAK
jgi:uncharacterized protein YdaU (DUF1376 family)